MSKDVEMKEVELNELDQEKQPMTGDALAEKNGAVKVKVPEDPDVKFTGLSKDELMKVAGTAGWVRTRWVLLVLFWLGWLGMLAGAIVIIIQAPRCKPLPEMNWWNEGPLYQIADVDAFTEDKGLEGVIEKLESLGQLKVKGLLLGPIHTVQKDQLNTLSLEKINAALGAPEVLDKLLDRAHKKSISIILDLTPNYEGDKPWFTRLVDLSDKLKAGIQHWMKKGVDGILLSSLDKTEMNPSEWVALLNAVHNSTEDGPKKRALIGEMSASSARKAVETLNSTGLDLLLSGVLKPNQTGQEKAGAVQQLYSSQPQTSLAWTLSGPRTGHLASVVKPRSVRLYQLLLFTLPGTPVFNYGDELGLEDLRTTSPKMVWDIEDPADEKNETAKALRAKMSSRRDWFRALSDLRGKERSLAHGDYVHLHNATSSLAYVRIWDQSERYLTALNWGTAPVTLSLSHHDLPLQAKVRLSTDPERHPQDQKVSLDSLELGPKEALLLSYPYTA
ncbi:solute carrier family 3 member 2a [Denticeps clupeoides]|uniref:Glycosyl hydrolase family 13 catalytic domain-containing protein n=1 Tax=Denticeps clupeoides TaxID=299321 RepID=A0AAY4BS58_9TELE|nr:4F2 cell-surface antigen heavy chain-like [Denticeps clupeoides]